MDHCKPITDGLKAEDWAGEMGERWLANLDRFEGMIAPLGDALLARAGVRAGERVVDIGCGGGATSREIARRVQPGGTVVGVDISTALVAEAARRAATAGLTNIAFVVADAAAARPLGAPFDRLVSRFGSMFFADPAAAFQNIGRMLRTGARADFAVWAPARENAWVAGLMGVLDVMSFGALVQEHPAAVRAAVEAEFTALFAAHRTPDGIAMGANAWLVSASAG